MAEGSVIIIAFRAIKFPEIYRELLFLLAIAGKSLYSLILITSKYIPQTDINSIIAVVKPVVIRINFNVCIIQ